MKSILGEYENIIIWKKYFFAYKAQSLDFKSTVKLMMDIDNYYKIENSLKYYFNSTLRLKLGIKDTKNIHP